MLTLLRSVANAQTNLHVGLTNTTENLSGLSNSIFLLLVTLYKSLQIQSQSQASNLMDQILKISTETNNPDLQTQIMKLAQQATTDMQK